MGGVEKKAPIDLALTKADGGAEKRDVEKSEPPCSPHGLTHVNPMPTKKRSRSSAVLFGKLS